MPEFPGRPEKRLPRRGSRSSLREAPRDILALHKAARTRVAAMFIGVDGGGTKTEMVVLDSEGVIRATHRTGGSSYLALGLEALGTLLAQGIETLLGKAGLRAADVEFAFFGLPAFGEDSSLTSCLSRLPERCLPTDSYLCGNDMICGWAGSLLCRDGISVVAGT